MNGSVERVIEVMNYVDSVSIIWNVSIVHLNLKFISCFSLISFSDATLNEMLSAIWYPLYKVKNVKNTNGGVLLLGQLQTLAVTLSSHSPAVMYLFKLTKKQ